MKRQTLLPIGLLFAILALIGSFYLYAHFERKRVEAQSWYKVQTQWNKNP